MDVSNSVMRMLLYVEYDQPWTLSRYKTYQKLQNCQIETNNLCYENKAYWNVLHLKKELFFNKQKIWIQNTFEQGLCFQNTETESIKRNVHQNCCRNE